MSARGKTDSAFETLQEAHRRLTRAYVQVHQASSRFYTRPIVDDHLRRRLGELHDAYIHAAETDFDSPQQARWLHQEATDFKALASTFTGAWRPGKLASSVTSFFNLAPVGILFGITGAGAAALAILQSCLCHLMTWTPLVGTGFLLTGLVFGFQSKRELFVRADTGISHGIYGAEDAVFRALGGRKAHERPIDGIGWLWIATAWLVFAVLGSVAIEEGLFAHKNHWLMYVFAAAGLALAVYAFARARSRRPQ
jgi:hypothetical protein